MAEQLLSQRGKPAKICDLCDPPKPVSIAFFENHQFRQHGVTKTKGKGGRPAKKSTAVVKVGQRAFTPRPDGEPLVVLTRGEPDAEPTFRRLDNFFVLADSDGHIYVAERIK